MALPAMSGCIRADSMYPHSTLFIRTPLDKNSVPQVRLPWLFDSVERGVLVGKQAFLVGAGGMIGEEDVVESQEW